MIAYAVCLVIISKRLQKEENLFFLLFAFLVVSNIIWLFSYQYDRFDILSYFLFAFVMISTLLTFGKNKNLKVFSLLLIFSLVVSALVAFTLYPILNSLIPQSPIFLYLFNVNVPFLYYYIFPTCLTSFFLGYLWIYCLDSAFQQIRSTKLPRISFRKSILIYFQFVPISLLPIYVAQILGRTDLLGDFAFLFNFLCMSYILLLGYSLGLAILGSKIMETKYLWVSSVLSIASVASTLYLAFQFIVWNVPYGAWALSFILAPLISYISGTVAKRYLDHSENTTSVTSESLKSAKLK